MNFLFLVWKGLTRKKVRTALTWLSVFIAFLMFGLLSAMNELFLDFAVTPALIGQGIACALLVGLIGGFFPALRAARLPVATALRES